MVLRMELKQGVSGMAWSDETVEPEAATLMCHGRSGAGQPGLRLRIRDEEKNCMVPNWKLHEVRTIPTP